MLSKALMHIWDRKLAIKKIEREVRLKELAHHRAYGIAVATIRGRAKFDLDTTPPTKPEDWSEYSQIYDIQFAMACRDLGVRTEE